MLACVCFGVLSWVLSAAAAEEAWYVVLLGEERAGFVYQATQPMEKDLVITKTVMNLSVARGGSTLQITLKSSFVETPDGKPGTATSIINMGGVPIVTEMTFHDDHIAVRTSQGGRTSEITRPLPEVAWLTPAAGQRYVKEQLDAGAEKITVTTIDPSMGLDPVTVVAEVLGREEVEVFGRTVPAVVWDATTSNMPGIVMREYVDETGRSLKSTVEIMPGLKVTIVEADRDLAMSPLTAPEMMVATLIRPMPGSEKIKHPRKLRQARYRIGAPSIDYAWPDSSAQHAALLAEVFVPDRVARAGAPHAPGGAWWLVRVHALPEESKPGKLAPFGVAPPTPRQVEALLQSSLVLNHEDPVVLQLRDDALAPLKKHERAAPAVVAEHLRRFVHDYVQTKDLSVGFATASEVARTKQGDCTEHGVLLAALLRGAGIPSRCVSGIVYVDEFLGQRGVFGYHLWTQAWLDPDGEAGPAPPRWVDLDATLSADHPFDATHIALSVSAMNEATPANDMVRLAPLLGNLRIEVIEAD